MSYIICDLEATCWEHRPNSPRMETIEIGAVRMRTATGEREDEFDAFIQPVVEPKLSEFCTRLTTIQQSDVDAAETFGTVFSRFLAWIGEEPFYFCAWGSYDLKQLRIDCKRHKIAFPRMLERTINLKREFARVRSIAPCGLKYALELADIPMVGQPHRGIVDARNLAALAPHILPHWEAIHLPG